MIAVMWNMKPDDLFHAEVKNAWGFASSFHIVSVGLISFFYMVGSAFAVFSEVRLPYFIITIDIHEIKSTVNIFYLQTLFTQYNMFSDFFANVK
jgi:hypothetical protein